MRFINYYFTMYLLVDCYFRVLQNPKYVQVLKKIICSSQRASKNRSIFPTGKHGKVKDFDSIY